MEAVSLAYDEFEPDDDQVKLNPIILTHGLFWNKYMFKELGRRLSKETKRKVFSLDLRCHGESPFRDRCDTLIMTEDVKKFLSDHKLKKVAFVCHSFSVTIAYLIALEKPELVEKIVMIDQALFLDYTETILKEDVPQFTSQHRFLKRFDPSMPLVEAKKEIADLSSITNSIAQKIFLLKVAYDLDKENNTFKWKTDIEFLFDKYQQKAFIVEPKGFSNHEILIFRCENSVRVSDEKFERILKHAPNAKLVTMEKTTHLLMFEKMIEFVAIVKNFLTV